MEIIGLLLAPVVLGSFIWLLIRAFKKSIFWGLWLLLGSLVIAVLAILIIPQNSLIGIIAASLLSLAPTIHFGYKCWEQEQKPFLTYIISSALFLIFSASMLASLGDDTLEALISQAQKGQLSEEETAKRMRALIQKVEDSSALSEQQKLSMRTAMNMINQVEQNLAEDPDYYKRETNADYQRDLASIEAQRKREESRKNLESRLSQRTAVENKPQAKKPRIFPTIKKTEIKKYIGSTIIIETTTNIKHTGILIGFDDETYSAILEKERKTGKLKFEIHMSDIKTLYLFVDE